MKKDKIIGIDLEVFGEIHLYIWNELFSSLKFIILNIKLFFQYEQDFLIGLEYILLIIKYYLWKKYHLFKYF